MKLSEIDHNEVTEAPSESLRLSAIDPSELAPHEERTEDPKQKQIADALANVEKFNGTRKPTSSDPVQNMLNQERAESREGRDPVSQTVQGFKDIGNAAVAANKQAGELLTTDPRKTFGDPRFRNEAMRGVNDAVMPYVGNRLVEAIGGVPHESKEDAAAFPGARAFGNVAGSMVPVPVGPAVSAAARGIEKLGAAAGERQIDRAAVALGERASKRVRGKLESKEGQPLRNVLGSEPDMMAAAHQADPVRAKAAETVIAKGQKDLQNIYAESDMAAGRQPVATEEITKAERLEMEAFHELRAAKQYSEGTADNLSKKRDAYQFISEAQRLRREAAKKITSENVRGIRGNAPIEAWNSRIGELRSTKKPSDARTADELVKLRDEYTKIVRQDQIIPSIQLRSIQSDYQRIGYKNPTNLDETPRVLAHQEASKIVGEPIIKHVTGMDYASAKAAAEADPKSLAARLFSANEKVEVGNNILAGIETRKGLKPQETSTAKKILKKVAHGGGHVLPAALTHGASLPITVGAELALRSPPTIDRVLSAAGKAASKVPDYQVVNPIGSLVQGIRNGVNKMEAVKSAVPRNPELGAVDIGSMPTRDDIEAAMKGRRQIAEAKDRTKDALDRRLSEEERQKAIREVLNTLGDLGNE